MAKRRFDLDDYLGTISVKTYNYLPIKKSLLVFILIALGLIIGIVGAVLLFQLSGPRSALQAHPAAPVEGMMTANEAVNDAVVVDGILYLGGRFSAIGQHTGVAVSTDKTSGSIDQNTPIFYQNNTSTTVRAIEPDGVGGWYVGGTFTNVGGQIREGLAHVLADGSLDPDFAVSVSSNLVAYDLLLDGNTLYVAGSFTTIGGQARNRLAAVDVTDSSVKDWNPNVTHSISGGRVTSMELDGTTLYIGGLFDTVDGTARNRLAAIDTTATTAGTYLTAWNPNVVAGSSLAVEAILLSGPLLYAGGNFTSVDGTARNNLAAIDTTTTTAGTYTTAWDPGPDGTILDLSFGADTLFVGGGFTTIGGASRRHVAALSTTTGTALPFDAAIDPASNSVEALTFDAGTLYLAGSFETVASQTRRHAAAVNATSGALLDYNPSSCSPTLAIEVQGQKAYLGSQSGCMNAVGRRMLAAIDLATGEVTDWFPGGADTLAVEALATDGQSIYIGGAFSSIGGIARSRIAAADKDSGVLTDWNPSASSTVFDLEYDNGLVYAGGAFTTIGGATRNRIAALDATTGLATGWDPNANSRVSEILIDGSTVYVGAFNGGLGQAPFTTIGGASRSNLAALDKTTGLATSWDPSPNNGIYDLAVSDGVVYASGLFTSIGGEARNFVAALDSVTGLATSWNPAPDASVTELHAQGDQVFMGGNFTTLLGEPRIGLGAVTSAGALSAWAPVTALTVTGSSLSQRVADIVSGSPAVVVAGSYLAPGTGQPFLNTFSLTEVQFATASSSVGEDAGSAGLTVSLSASDTLETTVDYTVTGGSATSGTDFVLADGTLTIPAGQTSGSIEVTLLDDSQQESTETVEVTLSDPSSNVLLGETTVHTLSITDNDTPAGLTRIQGATPTAQSIATSQARFIEAGSAPVGVVARNDIFADVMTVSPLVSRTGGTLLLNDPATLLPEVLEELNRAVGPGKTVYLAGREEAQSVAIEEALGAAGYEVTRLGGVDRLNTAALVGGEIVRLNDSPTTKVFITDDSFFADSLSTGAIAGIPGTSGNVIPILLNRRASDSLDPFTQDFLDEHTEIVEIELVGGPAALGAGLESLLGARYPRLLALDRTAGEDRFATNVALLERHLSTVPTHVAVASGEASALPGAQQSETFAAQSVAGSGFFNALLAGPFAAENQAALLLTRVAALPSPIQNYLQPICDTLEVVTIFGDTSQVSEAVEQELLQCLQ